MARSSTGPWGVVGWLAACGEPNQLAGAAFLIGPDIALTCAHVIRDHFGLPEPTPTEPPAGTVVVRLETLGIALEGQVLALGWFPDSAMDADGLCDIALIRLERPATEAVIPAIAGTMPNQRFDAFVFGAEPGYQSTGQQTQVKISGSSNARGWRSLESPPSGFAVKRGFSGAPAMDELGNTVWGMIAAVDAGGARVSFAIPADDLRRAVERVGGATGVRIADAADADARNAMIALREQLDGMQLDAARKEAEIERLQETVRAFEQRERSTEGEGPDRGALQALAQGDPRPAEELLRERIRTQRLDAAAAARQLGSLLSLTDSKGALAAYREAALLDPEDFWTLIEVGDRERRAGSLSAAAEAHQRAQDLAAGFVDRDPENTEWQRNLSVSHERTGDVRRRQGDLTGAVDAYNESLEIRTRLAAADPHNLGSQRDLSIIHNKIGDVRRDQRDLEGALDAYTKSLEIRIRLTAAGPHNTAWQRDLSVSHERTGEVRRRQGDLTGALDAYTKSLEIRTRLAATDSNNTEWQSDLAVSHEKIGDVRRSQGDLAGALDACNISLEIRTRLTAADPHNAEWQRDLSVSHDRIGDVRQALGDPTGARDAYNESLKIRSRLVELDPTNALWKSDLEWVRARIAETEQQP